MGDYTPYRVPNQFRRDGVHFPGNSVLEQSVNRILSADVPHFDVIIASFVRSGSQRLAEMSWLLMHDCDLSKAGTVETYNRCFCLELSPPDFHNAAVYTAPVVAKTHLPTTFVQKLLDDQKPKVIVGMRNPKDTLVSLFHFYRANVAFGNFSGTWDEYFELYRHGNNCMGDPIEHALGWWDLRARDDVLIVKYEDFDVLGAEAVIRNVAKFLDKTPSDDEVEAISKWISFTQMKENPMTNFTQGMFSEFIRADISPYMRKGQTGDWKNYFSAEQSAFVDKLYEEKCVPAGLTFRFE